MENKVEVVSKCVFKGVEYVKVFALNNTEIHALNKIDNLIDYHLTLGETYCDDSLNDVLYELRMNVLQESELVSESERLV